MSAFYPFRTLALAAASGAKSVDAASNGSVDLIVFRPRVPRVVLSMMLQSFGALLTTLGRTLFRHGLRNSWVGPSAGADRGGPDDQPQHGLGAEDRDHRGYSESN